jgi:hypothetical protein
MEMPRGDVTVEDERDANCNYINFYVGLTCCAAWTTYNYYSASDGNCEDWHLIDSGENPRFNNNSVVESPKTLAKPISARIKNQARE